MPPKVAVVFTILFTLILQFGCEKEPTPVEEDQLEIVGVPTVSMVNSTTAEVTWETNLPANSTVYYGMTSSIEKTVKDTEEREKHSVTISGLVSDTVYYYEVESSSEYFEGIARSELEQFNTSFSDTGEVKQLEILSGPEAVMTGSTSADVSWTTNLPSNSVVYYGLTEALGDSVIDDEERENHVVALSGLVTEVIYYYKVESSSAYFSGNPRSQLSYFQTSVTPQPDELEIVGTPQAEVTSPTSAEISWVTNFPANSVVYYGLTDALGNSVIDNEERQNHLVTISDLSPNTLYYYKVGSRSEYFAGNPQSSVLTFDTSVTPEPDELEIVGTPQAEVTSSTSAEISWVTNFPANSVVYYGLTDAVGDSVIDNEERQNHLMTLSDLSPNTLYYYKVGSRSEYFTGNPQSNVLTFETSVTPEPDELEIIGTPQAEVTSSTSAEISWVTNLPANSVVYYGLTDALGNSVVDDEERQNHLVTLSDLTPDAVYYYKVSSMSEHFTGNPQSNVLTFQTDSVIIESDELEIVDSPQVNLTSPITVEISWVTNLPANSVVYYGLTDALGDSVVDDEERQNHLVTLSDLAPDTVYYYQVSSVSEHFTGNPRSDVSTFRTDKNEESFTTAGWSYFVQEDYQSALSSFESALLMNSNYAGAYIGRGWANLRLEDLTSALSDFNAGLALDASLIDGYMGRALVYLSQQSYQQAISDAEWVIETDPNYEFSYDTSVNHILVRLVLAQAYYATQEYGLAQEQCDIIDPNNGLDPVLPDTWTVDGVDYGSYLEALLALIQFLVNQNA